MGSLFLKNKEKKNLHASSLFLLLGQSSQDSCPVNMLALRTTLLRTSRSTTKAPAQPRAARLAVSKQTLSRATKLRYATDSGSYRVETDTFGEIKVPSDRYWGAQTQRYVGKYICTFYDGFLLLTMTL